MRPLSERNNLIVCFGKTMDELSASVISVVARRHPQCHLQFVMSDWIAADQLASAALFWVVDPSTEVTDIAPALEYGVPLLVPEASSGLTRACIDGNYGLFYQTEEEAMACLIYLVSNRHVREFLAKNASASRRRFKAAVR